jgi:hypothetical protein
MTWESRAKRWDKTSLADQRERRREQSLQRLRPQGIREALLDEKSACYSNFKVDSFPASPGIHCTLSKTLNNAISAYCKVDVEDLSRMSIGEPVNNILWFIWKLRV